MIGEAWWAIIAILALISVVMRQSQLFLMTLLLAIVGGASYLWTKYCLAGVSYRRRFGATRLFYGEETDLDVEITNAKPLPLAWLRADDGFPEDVKLLNGRLRYSHLPRRRRLVNLLSLRWYEMVTRHYRLKAVQRGAWEFGPLELESGDIFGLALKAKQLPETETLIVYPKIVPITDLGLPARHPFGDYKTTHRLIEDPLRLMGSREYQQGDSPRHIHWKASARQQTLQTKVFDPSASRPLAIFLNINTFRFPWEGLDQELQELAITVAASIAHYAWEERYQLGLYVNSVAKPAAQRIRLRPSSHPTQLNRVLEALARTVDYGRWPISRLLDLEAGNLPYGTTIVVITPLIDDELKKTLLNVKRREHAVTLIAIGDAQLDVSLPGVTYYHIGRKEAWHELAALEFAA